MVLLTLKQAAKLFSQESGLPFTAWHVRDAVERGSLRAERGPGRRNPYLIPDSEVEKVLEEHRRERALQAGRGGPPSPEEQLAQTWDALPRRSIDYLWRVDWTSWKRQSQGRGDETKPGSPHTGDEDRYTDLRAELESRAQQKASRQDKSQPLPKRAAFARFRKNRRKQHGEDKP